MRIIRDDIDKFFDYGLDIQTRTLYMGSVGHTEDTEGYRYESGTDYSMAEYMLKGLHTLDNKGTGDITILMNNLGGDEYHGLAIYDAIRCCQSWVILKAFGHTMSMGSWIMQAADERLMAPNATMMLHNGEWGGWDRGEHVKDALLEYERLNKIMYAHYLERIREVHPKYTEAKLRQKLDRRDIYMTAQETVDLGLANGIISYPKHAR